MSATETYLKAVLQKARDKMVSLDKHGVMCDMCNTIALYDEEFKHEKDCVVPLIDKALNLKEGDICEL